MTIEETALAFIRGIKGKCHNAHTDGTHYWLHGHLICTKYGEPGKYVLAFDWCGYYTKTTTNHINNILRAAGANVRVGYASARRNGTQRFEVAV